MPTSSRDATRPFMRARPSVGSVIRLSTFSSVLLPAPFRPTNPRTSPWFTSKEMLRMAQNVSAAPAWTSASARARSRLSGDRTAADNASRRVAFLSTFRPSR